jgi:Tol biopolymer transport system component
MRKSLFYILFIASTVLNSCTSFQDFTFDSERTQSDFLLYRINLVEQPQIMLYDPVKNVHTQVLPDWDIGAFSLNINNRLAFSAPSDGNNNIYILDYPFTDNTPIELTHDTSSKNYPLSWSPDGSYLLFSSTKDESNKLMLWDGKTVSRIYDYHEAVYEYTWNSNNQLAFTDFYTFSFPYDGDPSEIFIWDGNKTVSASQNPSGTDRYPAWSNKGQLAFLSERNGKYDVFVWDGKSMVDDIPDSSAFINAASNLEHSSYGLAWTSSDTLTFSAFGASDTHAQIYEWDGETIRNISNKPSSDNGGQSWSKDDYWSFMAPFSGSQNIHIRNAENHAVLTIDGYYMPVWSPNGLLMFCANDPSGWVLSIWNGSEIIEIVHGDSISAKWKNGSGVVCSSG